MTHEHQSNDRTLLKWSSQGAGVLNLFLLLFPKSLEYVAML